MDFVHLHVHTEYSLLDGAAKIKDLISRTKELGMTSIAITDHGAMFGVIDFYKEAKAQGIHPIIGCEVYLAKRTMFDKEPDKDKFSNHLILIAENNTGYRNLMKIVSESYTKGLYYKPRVDYELLEKHHEGIIALSACLAGRVQAHLLNGEYDKAKEEALRMENIFGKGNFFIEMQNQGLSEEKRINPLLKRISDETGIETVATNDVHYVNREDAKAHDILLCIQTAASVDDDDRMSFPNDQFYLKSPEEMAEAFKEYPEAISNTVKFAERCNVEIDFGKLYLPEFYAPCGKDNFEYLKELCEEGIRERYGESADTDEIKDRLTYELETIKNMGYVEYFLIVWDFINYAKMQNIMVGPGRGSAAGSIVSYALRITDIDPIRYDLIFERFLNPERVSMPDIDIDFCYERRQEVIDYVIEKYGADKVSQIITFGTMKAKAAIRDVGRALNMTYQEVDVIAKMVPFDLKMTIDKAIDLNPDLRDRYEEDIRVKNLIDMSKALEGMPRHASTHAAGVVISKESIDKYVPLYMKDKIISTQFPMTTIEELGLLKMDFLGLRNLTVIRDALDLIEKNHGISIDFSSMVYDDQKVFSLIASGNTQGVFQLESQGMTQFMKNLKPDCFEDIVAGISLYRPGPMASISTYIENKKNPDKTEYLHEKLKPILAVTYGCLVYQEQVMRIVRDLAGYTYGRSDLVRRAMSKKKMNVMLEEQEYFINGKVSESGEVEIAGCVRNGVPEPIAMEIYNQMISFAEYAFNKSHAAAYAVLAYETAYLKTYYPVEFMAALMTSVTGEASHIAKYIRNCEEMGIKILPPDVNRSYGKFTVEGNAIRFGLGSVKNVGEGAIDEIIRARREKLPESIFQFIDGVKIADINKKAVESLIKAGAFDCFDGNRAQFMSVFEGLIESAQSMAKKNIAGQMSLFGDFEESGDSFYSRKLPDLNPFSEELILSMEKEMLGVYISGHPLDKYKDIVNRVGNITTFEISQTEDGEHAIRDGEEIVIAGMIAAKKSLLTKSNTMMAFVDLEDFYGTCEVIVFPRVYERYRELIKEDEAVAIKGRINFKEDEAPKILADTIVDLEVLSNKKEKLKLRIKADMDEIYALNEIKRILKAYEGDSPVYIISEERGRTIKVGKELYVSICEPLIEELGDYIDNETAQ